MSGCTARVAGYTSPIEHDYGPVRWAPLTATVEQAFVAGPGTSAAIDNDAKTTPELFRQRRDALPRDAREGRLVEVRAGLRLADETGAPWATGARLLLVDAAGTTLLDRPVDDLPRDGDWLRVTRPPDVAAGAIVRLRLVPGSGPDAGRLEYGLTTDRAPYGGWRAGVLDSAGQAQPLAGALFVQTRYDRDIDARGVLHRAAATLRGFAEHDSLFAALWLALTAALIAAALALALVRRPAGAGAAGD